MRKKSLKFKHMSKNTIKLIFTLLGNQNLIRYIHYLGGYNPLDSNLPDVSPGEVKTRNFVLTTFNEKILEETKVSIFLYPHVSNFSRKSTAKDIYELVIAIPYKYWVIEGVSELRAFEIANEIAKSIDFENIVGIGNIYITRAETFKVNDEFSGLVMNFEVTNPNVKFDSNG
jgi:hypothetical protein